MKLEALIEQLNDLNLTDSNKKSKRAIERVVVLLKEVQSSKISEEEKQAIGERLNEQLPILADAERPIKSLRLMKQILRRDFGFSSPEYYLVAGVGLGIAFGNVLGITASFGMGIEVALGMMSGSLIGLITGLTIGAIIDRQRWKEGRVLKSL